MGIFLAVLLGICAGTVGFVPLVIGLKISKRTTHAGAAGSMFAPMMGLLVSFIVLFLTAVLFVIFDKPRALVFALAEVVALCVSAIGYGVKSMLTRK